jgi:hypothetical protein
MKQHQTLIELDIKAEDVQDGDWLYIESTGEWRFVTDKSYEYDGNERRIYTFSLGNVWRTSRAMDDAVRVLRAPSPRQQEPQPIVAMVGSGDDVIVGHVVAYSGRLYRVKQKTSYNGGIMLYLDDKSLTIEYEVQRGDMVTFMEEWPTL